MYSYTYNQSIFNKNALTIDWGKKKFPKNDFGTTEYPHPKE